MTLNFDNLKEPTSADLNAMVEIFSAGQIDHHEKFPDIFDPPTDKAAINHYLQSFLKPRNPLRKRQNFSIGWFCDDRLCGYLLYRFYQRSDIFFGKDRWICFVEDIAVHPDHHQKGAASSMMSYIKDLSLAHKNCLFSAQIWRGNEASEALFKKFGFTQNSSHFHCATK